MGIKLHSKLLIPVICLLAALPLLVGACTTAPVSAPTRSAPATIPAGVTPPSATPPPISPFPTFTSVPTLAPTPEPTSIPTPVSSPTPTRLACWSQPGRTDRGSLDDERLRQPMDYRIHLPPCYAELPEQRYPVLYLIHGQSYNDDQWERLGAGELADQLAASGELPPFIIVMPRDRIWEQPTYDKFGDVLVDTLIPLVDRTYRTLPERKYRAVGGLSRGASWSIHLGLFHADLFGALGGHSPPVFHLDTPKLRPFLDETPPESLPRIFLDIGESDRPEIMRSALWFEALLTEKDIPHEWYLFPGYHTEEYWSSHLELYLRWYAKEW